MPICPENMKITIVVPIYNVAPYVGDCIRSVMRQTWQGRLECIFVDDCGTDDSMEIVSRTVEEYHGDIDFRIVGHDQNRGLSAARNTGIDAATGDYVYFLDSDDEITSDCVEALAAPLRQEDYDFTIADCRLVGNGDKPDVALKLKDGTVLKGAQIFQAYRHEEWYMMSVNKLYRLDFLKSCHLRFKDGILFEDELWSFQVACLAQSMAVVGRDTYIYKLREGSITVNHFTERKAQSLRVILQEMCTFADRHGLQTNSEVHHFIENFRIACLNRIYQYAPDLFDDYYKSLRQLMTVSWRESASLDGWDWRKQVRDFHLALPLHLAIPYMHLLLSYYQKKAQQ